MPMPKVSYYVLSDLVKNRVILGYVLLLAAAGWGIFMIESQPEKALLVLMQIMLLALPLITMVFATIYYYNSREFITLLLTQPMGRRTVIVSFFVGLSTAFVGGFLVSVGLPLLLFYPTAESAFLILSGVLLTLIFIAIALYLSTRVQDKARGMGATLLLWAFFAFLYDGLLLFFMYQFGEYPIERGVLALSLLNPIDVARVAVIMKTEASALLGLSGAVFREFFGSSLGVLVSFAVLLLWVVVPYALAQHRFLRKDL